jgi:hypothetical protein
MFKLASIAVLTTAAVAGTAYAQSIDVNVPVISVPIGSGSATSQPVLGAIKSKPPGPSPGFGVETVAPIASGRVGEFSAPGLSSAPGLLSAPGLSGSAGRGR